MPKILKKISLILLSSILFANSMIMPFAVAKAQDEAPSTWYNQGFTDWYAKVYGDESPPSEIFGERYTAAQVQWIMYALVSIPLNFDPDTQKIVACFFSIMSTGGTDILTCGDVLIEKMDKFKEFMDSTIIATDKSSNLASLVFDTSRSMSGIGYVSNLVGKYHLIPEAQAQNQGFGYTALNPIQKYWSGARDISYALIVFVVIVFAFMIMFRIKLSPQLVISVQSSLPKVISALVLVTFSYAISGFMIDLMYIFGGLFALLIKTGNFSTQEVTAIYKDIFPPNQTGLYFLLHMLWYDTFFLFAAIINMVAALVSFGGTVPGVGFSIVMILLIIWILILSLWYTFKATWVLIKSLISFYINVITAPIQFMIGVLVPSMGFGSWFKRILADLLVFPVTGLFMFFAWRLMWLSYSFGLKAIASENIFARIIEAIGNRMGADTSWFDVIWVPEILGFGQATSGMIILLMSFAIIAAVPKVPDILKMLILGAKFDFGSAIGEAMGPVKMAGGLAVNPQMDRFELAAKKAMKTPWEVASKGGPSLQAKYISLSALQKWLSGR